MEAGVALARQLARFRDERPVVLALPRGGVPVAAVVARVLRAPLDVALVRKLGVPYQPELAAGAIGEGGVRVVNDDVRRAARVSADELAAVEARERAELERRAEAYRRGRPPVPVVGRTVVLVDDGIATGSTVLAACAVARARGAARVVVATPVAPRSTLRLLESVADEVVCVTTPDPFFAIGEWYEDFSQTTDAEVVALLRENAERLAPRPPPDGGLPEGGGDADPPQADRAGHEGMLAARDGPPEREVTIDMEGLHLGGALAVPEAPLGIVVFAHGSGSSRFSPRNREVAAVLRHAGLATLLFDLLSPAEASSRRYVFDVSLLAGRLGAVTRWLEGQPELSALPVAFFGASTGAAAALWAAAEPGADVAAIVSRGGRPDLAERRLWAVRAPTLLIVGEHDPEVLALNRRSLARLPGEKRLDVVAGAGHLFEEPGTLRQVAGLSTRWFVDHLSDRDLRP